MNRLDPPNPEREAKIQDLVAARQIDERNFGRSPDLTELLRETRAHLDAEDFYASQEGRDIAVGQTYFVTHNDDPKNRPSVYYAGGERRSLESGTKVKVTELSGSYDERNVTVKFSFVGYKPSMIPGQRPYVKDFNARMPLPEFYRFLRRASRYSNPPGDIQQIGLERSLELLMPIPSHDRRAVRPGTNVYDIQSVALEKLTAAVARLIKEEEGK